DTALRQIQERLTNNPADPLAYAVHAQLGSLYLQKVRETGDPSYYARAEAALQQSLALGPDNALAAAGMGALSLARHDFDAGLHWGETARRQAPWAPGPLGIVADALTELGRYDEAVAAVQEMVDLRPDLASLSRVSYARELHGDLPGAVDAMRRALDAASPGTEAAAWARIHLAHLLFLTGNLDGAKREYGATLAYLPDYVHGLAGRARVAAARGDLKTAIEFYESAQATQPVPEYAIALGDVYRAAGRDASAARQDELVRVITRLQRSAGVDVDLELSVFEAERAAAAKDRRALEDAVETAAAQHARRPDSVAALDALAWTLHLAGRSQEALPLSHQALRLNTQDPLVLYHAGAIASAAGNAAEARTHLEAALARNPHFHPRYAQAARVLLESLRR
ncbi:MAG TPA: tetratricopeptide repeat protein, partial [Chloroflexota bacterium]|nr:tetratricopeptide repeat protein [Chloroflexota bacterium]